MKIIVSSRCVFKLHGYGGMERYAYYFSKHLDENGTDVTLITSTTRKQIPLDLKNLELKLIKPNVNESIRYVKPINYRLWLRNVSMWLKKRTDFDIVHAFGICPVEYLRLKNRKPVVIQPFGNEEFKSRENEYLFKRIYLDFFIRNIKIYSVQNADAIASEGEIQTKEIMQFFGVSKEKIFHLPDGVDLDEIEEYLKNAEITRKDYNLQDADIVLINVNRLEPNKGVPYLIEALKILNQELNVGLILVGTGSEEEKIKSQIKRLGLEEKVKHFKNIPDELMFQLYTLADISVTPTLYEGLPLVILEAMACGKPIVASNVSEVPQAVKDGVNGFLVPPKNPRAIVDKILEIYDKNLFVKMGVASKKIVKNYDWSKIAKMAIRKYEELVR
uniref:Glycosyltransferase family 1 protein n=1 Tax=candidate division WOR-3 bacterium TaxID=2052148 RepID=A0A7C2P259_UNCW3